MSLLKMLFGVDKKDKQDDIIKEPVRSFLSTVKKDLKRFKITVETSGSRDSRYTLYDKHTNLTFSIEVAFTEGMRNFGPSNNISFLTGAECSYILNVIAEVYRLRRIKLKKIKRERLMKVYCTESI